MKGGDGCNERTQVKNAIDVSLFLFSLSPLKVRNCLTTFCSFPLWIHYIFSLILSLPGIDVQDTYVLEIEEPSGGNVDTLRILDKKKDDVLPGFKAASKSENQLERYFLPYATFL